MTMRKNFKYYDDIRLAEAIEHVRKVIAENPVGESCGAIWRRDCLLAEQKYRKE